MVKIMAVLGWSIGFGQRHSDQTRSRVNNPALLIFITSLTAIFSAAVLQAAGAPVETPPATPEKAEGRSIRSPEDAYFRAIAKAESIYREALASSLNDADEIEVFLLDFETQPIGNVKDPNWFNRLPLDLFPIVPAKAASRIINRRSLSENERKLLLPPLQRILIARENTRDACHFPIHGIRIWRRNVIVFQTSICCHCHTFYIKYPPTDSSGFLGFSDAGFCELMNKLMPIPQHEIDRFNEKYPQEAKVKNGAR
jgi:hypothetical protein